MSAKSELGDAYKVDAYNKKRITALLQSYNAQVKYPTICTLRWTK